MKPYKLCLFFLLLLAACSAPAEPTIEEPPIETQVEPTSKPTDLPPTATTAPTATPLPTDIPTPAPTEPPPLSDEDIETFFTALTDGDTATATDLITAGILDLNPLKNGDPPLLFAVRQDQPDLVTLLIENGVDLRGEDTPGYTALGVVARAGNIPIMTILLDAGMDPNAHNTSPFNTTPFIEAARGGHVAAGELLLSYGADIHLGDNHDNDPALNWAVFEGKAEFVAFLIANGVDVNLPNDNGYTALRTSIARGHPDIEAMLREVGAVEYIDE